MSPNEKQKEWLGQLETKDEGVLDVLKTLDDEAPWEHEPDSEEWVDRGFQCRIRRTDVTGSLCGYIAVSKDHPWWGKGEDAIDANPHGGFTYSSEEDDGLYWVGFDCGHAGDVSPALDKRLGSLSMGGTYRTIEYVREEVRQLVDAALKGALTPPTDEENDDE